MKDQGRRWHMAYIDVSIGRCNGERTCGVPDAKAGSWTDSSGDTAGGDAALLRALGVDPDSVVRCEPAASGMSGARLARLMVRETATGTAARYSYRVLKQLEPESGWLGALSRDTLLREVRLWSRGVLSDLPAGIKTGVLAWAEANQCAGSVTGGLLLRDERAHLLRDALRTPSGHLPMYVRTLLDALARLHARYWCDTRLRDRAVGLMSPRAALLLAAPDALASRVADGDEDAYLPLALAGWETFFRLAAPEDASALRGVFADPARVLAALDRLPWTLAHGDVWGPNLGMLPATRRTPRQGSSVLLLDWALAVAGPATYDPLWLCGTWHALAPVRVLAAYRARLARHLAARGVRLAPEVWRTLADAGYLRTALTCGEALGRAAAEAVPGAPNKCAAAHVRWWAARGARAARRLAGAAESVEA
jgi:hypothetical protein